MLPLKLACKKERERERERGRGQERKKEKGEKKVLVYSKFFLACVMKLFVIVASV